LQQQGYDTGRTRASRAYAGEQTADERASGDGPKTFSKPVILVLSLISCLACSYAAYSTAATGANMRMEQISSKLESSHSELREWLLENANAGEGSDEVSKATSMFLRQALDTCVTFNVFAGDGSYLRNASGTFTGIGDYIIASAHSLEGCGSLMMANSEDDESVPCRIIATDAGHDLVLVAPESPVAGHSNPVAPRADAEVGETVYAIGSHGVHESVAHGIVSGTGRFTFDPATREATMSGLLQVDATIGEAGCGGLVVNGYGEAIGIVVSLEYDRYSMDGDIAEDPEQAMGIAYALPWGEALAAAEAMAGAV
jgi:S1-C subfamily serine protease